MRIICRYVGKAIFRTELWTFQPGCTVQGDTSGCGESEVSPCTYFRTSDAAGTPEVTKHERKRARVVVLPPSLPLVIYLCGMSVWPKFSFQTFS